MPRSRIIVLLLVGLFSFSCKKEKTFPPSSTAQESDFETQLIHDEIDGVPVIIAGNPALEFIISFKRQLPDGVTLNFLPVKDRLPVLMEDEEGNEWDIFGEAVSGDRIGQKLEPTRSYMGFWFVFGAMYPGIEIYGQGKEEVNISENSEHGWLIPTDHIRQGNGFNIIKAVDAPVIIDYDFREYDVQEFYVKDSDLTVAVKVGTEIRAYPHKILDYHEIVNDEIAGQPISIIYCPLTGTTSIWKSEIDGLRTTFGVSGYVYNSNILPYDRLTESFWTQLEGRSVRGELAGDTAAYLPYVEMPWKSWKNIFRHPKVLSDQTGSNHDYKIYPYGTYRTNHDKLLFPIVYDDNRLARKDRVHAIIINGVAKVYPFTIFPVK